MANDTQTTSETAPAATAEKKKKAKVSDRFWIDAEGKETNEVDNVVGFKYVSVSEPGALAEARFTGDGALPTSVIYGLAAFGGLTLAGNVTNTIRNGEPKADGPQTEKEALEIWIKELLEGNWTRPTGEVDPGLGLLAQAVARHFDEVKPLPDGAKRVGNDENMAKVMDWLKGLDKDARKGWRADPKVNAHLKRIQLEKAEANAAKAGESKPLDVPADI